MHRPQPMAAATSAETADGRAATADSLAEKVSAFPFPKARPPSSFLLNQQSASL